MQNTPKVKLFCESRHLIFQLGGVLILVLREGAEFSFYFPINLRIFAYSIVETVDFCACLDDNMKW